MIKYISKITEIIERLAAKNVLVYQAASLYYKNLVKDEVALANIGSKDKILCIGGGQCPFSGILLHECTEAHVTIIDNNKSCVQVSRKLIGTLGYEKFINVLYSDGKDISPADYSVIHLAVQVSPMEEVFSHLRQGCHLGSKILVRLPKKTLTNFYSLRDQSIFHNYCRKAVHNWKNIESTLLFVKSKEEFGT